MSIPLDPPLQNSILNFDIIIYPYHRHMMAALEMIDEGYESSSNSSEIDNHYPLAIYDIVYANSKQSGRFKIGKTRKSYLAIFPPPASSPVPSNLPILDYVEGVSRSGYTALLKYGTTEAWFSCEAINRVESLFINFQLLYIDQMPTPPRRFPTPDNGRYLSSQSLPFSSSPFYFDPAIMISWSKAEDEFGWEFMLLSIMYPGGDEIMAFGKRRDDGWMPGDPETSLTKGEWEGLVEME